MDKQILKARVDDTVLTRSNVFVDWTASQCASISVAKKLNGLNSVAFDKRNELPKNQNRRVEDRRGVNDVVVVADLRKQERRAA